MTITKADLEELRINDREPKIVRVCRLCGDPSPKTFTCFACQDELDAPRGRTVELFGREVSVARPDYDANDDEITIG